MKYLLDTNVLSEPLKIQPDSIVMERLQQHQDHIATATIVLHELYYGCYQLPPSPKEKTIKKYIEEVVGNILWQQITVGINFAVMQPIVLPICPADQGIE
jgi:predicted nucleic acid-binding protein